MDRARREADGGRVIHRRGRVNYQVVVALVVQNVLVASCLLFSLYVYYSIHWAAEVPNPNTNIHIQFEAMPGASQNGTLTFPDFSSRYKMSVAGPRSEVVGVECTGPYLLHMYVCFFSQDQGARRPSRGTLALRAGGNASAMRASFSMSASSMTCEGLHSVVYLRAGEKVGLHLTTFDDFKMKNLTVGLSLLLHGECDY